MRTFVTRKWLPVLMVLTIVAIAAFQYYWLSKAYERESRTLEMRTNYLFRETMLALQGTKLKLDRFTGDSSRKRYLLEEVGPRGASVRMSPDAKVMNMMDVLMTKAKDTNRKTIIFRSNTDTSITVMNGGFNRRRNRLMQFLFDVDSLQDSIRVREVQVAYNKKLKEQNLNVPYKVIRVPTIEREERVFNEVTLGFSNPITYKLELGNVAPFLVRRISIPILFSVFLVGFTVLSFWLLYRNLIRERRLADIKNDFISNITHELKTPIATVSVAIEALRSFNASMDPRRSQEYLDISANELQRLSLLVDKVLKLSMFEKKEIELRYEPLNMEDLVKEVTSSMRLQFEKKGAVVETHSDGAVSLQGDRLHLVSVIFNLLDNALKYSGDKPRIVIDMQGSGNEVRLTITDNGIGIPSEYHSRVFEKFFRVPTGNLHNAKGYGLGLSYVAHVVNQHKGNITVSSAEGQGSRFLIVLPQAASA